MTELSPEERLALREQTYRVADNGEIRLSPAHQGLKQRVRFTTALVQRLHPEYAIDFQKPGWGKLLTALDVRDRLTHPKSREDMDVSPNELTDALDGFDWFFGRVIGPGHAGLTAYVGRKYLREQIQASVRATQSHIMFGPLRNAFEVSGLERTPLALDAGAESAVEAEIKQAKQKIRRKDD